MQNLELRKFDFIDATRGLAILCVILVHSSQSIAPLNATLAWLMSEGARGVQLFYIASALTLCMSWAARSQIDKSPIRSFYIRRFFRIAPMFYLAILGSALVNGLHANYWAPNGIEWWFFPITATFLHGFHPETITSVVPGGWSIAVEMNFYLVLPLLLMFVRSMKTAGVLFAVSMLLYYVNLLLVPRMFSYPESQQYLVDSFAFLNFFGQLPVFAIGIFGYFVLREKYSRERIATFGGSVFLVLLALFLYPLYDFPSSFFAEQLLKPIHHIVAGALFCVFVIMLAYWPTGLLVNKVTIWLGKLSFSMYLLHFAVLKIFQKIGFIGALPKTNLGSILYFAGAVGVTFAVSFFTYQFVERPGIRLGAWLIQFLQLRSSTKPHLHRPERK